MPRKGLRPRDRRPQPAPDYKYNSVLVARFINKLNFEGKTSTAERILDDAMAIIAEKTKENALDVFTKCIENVRPLVEVKARRVGGANYQVPTEVKPLRSTSLAMRWLMPRKAAKAARWLKNWPKKLCWALRKKALPLRNAKTCIKWLKPTALSLILNGNWEIRYG